MRPLIELWHTWMGAGARAFMESGGIATARALLCSPHHVSNATVHLMLCVCVRARARAPQPRRSCGAAILSGSRASACPEQWRALAGRPACPPQRCPLHCRPFRCARSPPCGAHGTDVERAGQTDETRVLALRILNRCAPGVCGPRCRACERSADVRVCARAREAALGSAGQGEDAARRLAHAFGSIGDVERALLAVLRAESANARRYASALIAAASSRPGGTSLLAGARGGGVGRVPHASARPFTRAGVCPQASAPYPCSFRCCSRIRTRRLLTTFL